MPNYSHVLEEMTDHQPLPLVHQTRSRHCLKAMGSVTGPREIRDELSIEIRLFIMSKKQETKPLFQHVRSHWGRGEVTSLGVRCQHE